MVLLWILCVRYKSGIHEIKTETIHLKWQVSKKLCFILKAYQCIIRETKKTNDANSTIIWKEE